jgi:hypothetical protein
MNAFLPVTAQGDFNSVSRTLPDARSHGAGCILELKKKRAIESWQPDDVDKKKVRCVAIAAARDSDHSVVPARCFRLW